MSDLRLVIVEDSQDDAELLLITLRDAGFEPQWRRVEDEGDYLVALEANPDLVLCDYGLPQFSTRRALELLRARSADIPFIIVSGHIGDDVAVAMLKAGANDYLHKDKLARLGSAVARELREAEARRRQLRLEEALRVVADAVSGVTGKAFLESLVVQLAKATGSDYVFIGERDRLDRNSVHTVAVCAKDRIAGNFCYRLDETLATRQIFSGNRESEPPFPLLQELGLESYMGTPLVSSAGVTLGFMVVMHGAPIANAQVAESLLRIYALRAASELERMAQTAVLEFQATHDPLTQLCNRNALQAQMAKMINNNRPDTRGALLLIDLDRFKEINDTLGHPSGDEILKQIGPRFMPLLDVGQILCRLGGDEFAVLVTENADREQVEELANKLLDAISGSFEVAGIYLQIEASVGIALYPEHSRDPDELLRQADVAMYLAKIEDSHYRCRIYDSALDRHTRDRLMLMSELSHAIERNELVLHYQPKISLIGQDDVCLEALVRWQHPIRGLLPPARFIELAEMTDVIRLLTLWVMEEAARQCRQWRKAGYPVNVAVNISVRNLRDAGLPNEIANIVKQYGIKPAWLEFEITESAIMDIKSSLEILQRISSMGHLLSIDDFGAGYSTLAYLSRLPVQNLKIDRWFVQQMNNSPRDAGVVQATIGLAHNLGMRVIAEGVENGETLERLRNLGCDQAQGYFISKPKPAEEIEKWMDAQGLCAAV